MKVTKAEKNLKTREKHSIKKGKEIYAIPGNITSINSKGTNEIIKQGAKLVTCSEEIIEDIIN